MSKYLMLLASLLLTLGTAVPAAAGPGKCNMTKDEAYQVLKGFDPLAKVLDVRRSPIDELCEVAIEIRGKKVILYIDSSKKHMIAGSIIDVASKVNLTQQRVNDMNRVDTSRIPLDDALLLGKADAKYKVIVFDDPD